MQSMRIDRWTSGVHYDRWMGRWSRLLAQEFLQWLNVPAGRRWIDLCCGSGMVTEAILERGAPVSVMGVDASVEQIRFACEHRADSNVTFQSRGRDCTALCGFEFRRCCVWPWVELRSEIQPERSRNFADLSVLAVSSGLMCGTMPTERGSYVSSGMPPLQSTVKRPHSIRRYVSQCALRKGCAVSLNKRNLKRLMCALSMW